MNRRLLMSIFVLMTAFACHGSLARAALIVTVGDLNLREGGSGFVDVMIRSSDGSDLLDLFTIDLFTIDLLISPVPGVASRLEFVDLGGGIPSDEHLDHPAYLFANNSVGFGGSLTDSTLYSGGDGTSSGNGVEVPATDKLLVRLEVTAATFSPPVAGDTFTISVDFVEFLDPSLGPIDSDFPGSSGTVTITSRSAVIPEPASMAIWAILLAVLVIGMGRRQASE